MQKHQQEETAEYFKLSDVINSHSSYFRLQLVQLARRLEKLWGTVAEVNELFNGSTVYLWSFSRSAVLWIPDVSFWKRGFPTSSGSYRSTSWHRWQKPNVKATEQDLQSACKSSATCGIIPPRAERSCTVEFKVKPQWPLPFCQHETAKGGEENVECEKNWMSLLWMKKKKNHRTYKR